MNNAFILGVRVDHVTLPELIEFIAGTVQSGRKAVIPYLNVHAVNLCQRQAWFKTFINRSEVVFCDGFGVKWAARFLLGVELQRFTPPDWFAELAETCARRGISIYFLGARPEVIEKAAAVAAARHPGLKIAGFYHGYFDKSPASAENQRLIAEINAVRPGILLVGFGMPAQEKWILENRDSLNVNVAIPVGAFFDYLTGEVVRAPRWMTDHGLEWLGRLVIEPRRLWKRYILGNPLFLFRVLLQKTGLRKYPD